MKLTNNQYTGQSNYGQVAPKKYLNHDQKSSLHFSFHNSNTQFS